MKTWLASAAMVGGVSGGAVVGLTATGDPAQPAIAARPAAAIPNVSNLQRQIGSLLHEDHALKRAVSQARVRLAGQVHAGERSLAALHRRIVTAQAALAQAQSARTIVSAVTVAPAPAPARTPASHATTGASGAGSGHEGGEHEGGGGDD